MSNIHSLLEARTEALSRRRKVVVELPEFLIAALEHRAELASVDAEEGEAVALNNVVEFELVASLQIKDGPHFEQVIPGFNAALAKWLWQSNYEPPQI